MPARRQFFEVGGGAGAYTGSRPMSGVMAALVGVVDDAAQPTVPLGTGVGTEARGEILDPRRTGAARRRDLRRRRSAVGPADTVFHPITSVAQSARGQKAQKSWRLVT